MPLQALELEECFCGYTKQSLNEQPWSARNCHLDCLFSVNDFITESTITKGLLKLLAPVSILSTKSRLDHIGDKTMNYSLIIVYGV